jgi:potassium/chloride transporter 9
MSKSPSDGEQVVVKNDLGVINGCFVPCLLNILGAVLYLRIGFGVGHMGMFGCMMIFIFSEGIAYLTTSSFSAIVTNGEMKGGGAYYMISRNLGPAFGASSGLLFWFTYSITVTFNAVAFTETFLDTFFPSHNGKWASIACSSITLFLLFLVAFNGAGTFAKINVFIFVCLVISLLTGIGSIYFIFPSSTEGCEGSEAFPNPYPNEPCHIMKGDAYTHDGVEYYDGRGYFYSLSIQRMKDNMWPNPVISDQCGDQKCSLNAVFGVIFPAITGMMEGCNLSGDLKDPSYAIPTGTVAAISVAFVMYLLIIVGNAASMDRRAMQYDMFVMQHSCISQYLVVLGVAAACLSTSLGSMFGSSRILQAIARDDIIPILAPFKQGTAKGDEPRNAVILTYIIAQCGVFVGGLDAIGPVLTNFYLIVYALVNFATVLLELADLPNFRPPFKYYSWQTSLLGSVLTLATMFYMQPVFGLITVLIVIVLFVYIMRYGKQKPWGDISQAILFNQARSFLLRMQAGVTSTKFWQPSLLLISDDFEAEHMLVHFCNDLKKGGVLCFGQALLGNGIHEIHEAKAKAAWRNRGDKNLPSAHVKPTTGNGDGRGHKKGMFSTSMTTAEAPRSSYGRSNSSRLQLPNNAKQRVWAVEQVLYTLCTVLTIYPPHAGTVHTVHCTNYTLCTGSATL